MAYTNYLKSQFLTLQKNDTLGSTQKYLGDLLPVGGIIKSLAPSGTPASVTLQTSTVLSNFDLTIDGIAANQIPYANGTNTWAKMTAPSGSNRVLTFDGTSFTWPIGPSSSVNFIVKQPDSSVPSAFSLSTLTNNAIMKVSVSGGIGTPQNATAGTDYYSPGSPLTFRNGGTSSIYIGSNAGQSATGNNNVAIGQDCFTSSNSLLQVTAVGASCAQTNNKSNFSGLGFGCGGSNSGTFFSGLGYLCGVTNIGDYFTGLGVNAGFSNLGNYCTFIGSEAGALNTAHNVLSAGYRAGYNNAGISSTYVGVEAGYGTNGDRNVCLGWRAGYNLSSTSIDNVLIGVAAGTAVGNVLRTYSSGILIGSQCRADNGLTNFTGIGFLMDVTESNQIAFGLNQSVRIRDYNTGSAPNGPTNNDVVLYKTGSGFKPLAVLTNSPATTGAVVTANRNTNGTCGTATILQGDTFVVVPTSASSSSNNSLIYVSRAFIGAPEFGNGVYGFAGGGSITIFCERAVTAFGGLPVNWLIINPDI